MPKNLKLKAARAEKDMTQGALAEAAGDGQQQEKLKAQAERLPRRQAFRARLSTPLKKGSTTPPSTFAAVSVKFWIRHWMNCSGRNEL